MSFSSSHPPYRRYTIILISLFYPTSEMTITHLGMLMCSSSCMRTLTMTTCAMGWTPVLTRARSPMHECERSSRHFDIEKASTQYSPVPYYTVNWCHANLDLQTVLATSLITVLGSALILPFFGRPGWEKTCAMGLQRIARTRHE